MRDGAFFFVCSAGFLLDILMQIVELTSCTFLGKNIGFALCIQFPLKITLLVGDCLVHLSMLTSLLHEKQRKKIIVVLNTIYECLSLMGKSLKQDLLMVAFIRKNNPPILYSKI